MDIRASVAMAVCNGEKYIEQQIDTILGMMISNDELIISYDESNDRTLDIIKKYESSDKRVKVVYDNGHSVESNFNNAVANCSGKYIFLADQDDVWINNKIDEMVKYFETHDKCVVLVSDGYITDKSLVAKRGLFEEYHTTANPFRNFVQGTYLGCQMAFHSSIKEYVWPVRITPPLPHDLWLGVMGAFYGKVALLEKKTIMHRIHEENYTHTSKMNLFQILKNRWLFLCEIISRKRKNKREHFK